MNETNVAIPLESVFWQAILLTMLSEIIHKSWEDRLKVLERGRHVSDDWGLDMGFKSCVC